VATLPIIETQDIGKDVGLRLLARPVVLKVDMFTFEGAKETLHGSIVVTVARAAHADLDLLIAEKSLVWIASILAASIRMMQQSRDGCPVLDCHAESLLDQVAFQGGCKRPADNFAREEIQDHSQIQPAFGRGDIGDVG